MPGADACGRCGSALRLAAMALDVRPPRAPRWRKRLRSAVPLPPAYFEYRGRLRAALHGSGRMTRGLSADALPPWRVVWRMIVPGWSHFRERYRARGHAFLWLFLAFLLPGLLYLGTTLGSFLLGMAFSVHAAAAAELFQIFRPLAGVRAQIVRSIVISIALALLVYVPAGWAVGRIAAPRTILMAAEPFHAGDVVLVNRAFHGETWPRAGQVVLYELPQVRIDATANGRQRVFYQFLGERVDRVLAVAGDVVRWEDGQLYVNDAPSPWRPLNAAVLPAKLHVRVPAGRVLILPTTTPNVGPVLSSQSWETLSLVPVSAVQGHVYARTQPLARLTRFR